jgi:ubiquinone/menaquinone biosynthesis C-methylase UbiE
MTSIMLEPVSAPLARARYLARQHGLALSLGLFVRGMQALSPRGRRQPPPAELRELAERFRRILEADWQNAVAGVYPRRLLFDLPLRELLGTLPEYVADLPRVIARVKRGDFEDLPAGIDRERYPRYYLRNFHWQTDGWFSERSARLYDFGVDVLFGGTTDVMRRMAIPPVVEALRGQARPRVLDVACGTGRFLEQLHAALPTAELTGVDLSEPYLARARERLAGVPGVSLRAANAEALPFDDASFDAVTCVFLFHELPRDVRRRVVAEMRRVLRPGGTLAICDSAQLVDSAGIAFFLDTFHRLYHEPYYKGYLSDPLEDLLVEQGFERVRGAPHLVAKVVAAARPLPA